jgi:hypothetical protein
MKTFVAVLLIVVVALVGITLYGQYQQAQTAQAENISSMQRIRCIAIKDSIVREGPVSLRDEDMTFYRKNCQ